MVTLLDKTSFIISASPLRTLSSMLCHRSLELSLSTLNILRRNIYNSIHEIRGSKFCCPARGYELCMFFHKGKYLYTSYEDAVKIKKKTNCTESKKLIYYGQMVGKIKGLKVVSISTSVITLASEIFFYPEISKLPPAASTIFLSLFGFFTFITPILIHMLCKRYITEIIYDSANDRYTKRSLSFFLMTNEDKFVLDDVRKPESSSMFVTLYIKHKPVLIFPDEFLDKSHYIKMLGFNKPMDLRLSNRCDNSVGKVDSK